MKKKPSECIVNLDSVRARDEALFVCLHEDCFKSFSLKLPRRKNAVEDVICPSCGRDFYMYWITVGEQEKLIVNFGKKRRPKK